jgi:hypothetical protein
MSSILKTQERFMLALSSNSGGYSLIQMALAMLVVGILAGVFLNIYNQYDKTQRVIASNERVRTSVEAIQKFRNVTGTFPCPAPMNVSRTDASYGRASNYARYLTAPAGAVPTAAGGCAEGICIEQNSRTDLGAGVVLRVRVGAVPFRDLQLDESNSFDAYGSKLWYAVTEDMCNLATYDELRGAINIVNDQGESQTFPANSASFLVISPGENRHGGYSIDGVAQSACGTSTTEQENCRDVTLATSVNTQATYLSQGQQNATVATTYDDYVEYFSSAQTQLWRRTATGSENIVDLANASIGVGENSPMTALDIAQSTVSTSASSDGRVLTTNTTGASESGSLRVNTASDTNARIMAETYCDETGNFCFRPENITGSTGLTCPAGTYAVGIVDGAGKNAEFACRDIPVRCPSGQTFIGFTNVGGFLQPNCSNATSFASCPASTRDMCTTGDVTLSAGPHGTLTSIIYRGSCRGERYRCNNGTWVIDEWWGSCTNNLISSNTTNCNTIDACLTGTYSSTNYTCTGSSNNSATACTCAPCQRDVFGPNCTPPLTGTQSQTRFDYVCDPGNPYTPAFIDPMNPSGTVITPGSCSCSLTSRNIFFDCPAGYLRDAGAPPPAPSATAGTNSWPGDTRKGIYQFQTVDGSCTHVNSGSPVNRCVCNGTDQYSTELSTPPTCKKHRSGTRVVDGTSYDWRFDVYKATVDTGTCTVNPRTLIDAAQFDDRETFWKEISGTMSSDVYDSPPTAIAEPMNSPCSCAVSLGSNTSCYKANAMGKYNVYTCRCE